MSFVVSTRTEFPLVQLVGPHIQSSIVECHCLAQHSAQYRLEQRSAQQYSLPFRQPNLPGARLGQQGLVWEDRSLDLQ